METFICLDGYQFSCLICGIKPSQDEITTCDGPRCNGIIVYRQEDGASFVSIVWVTLKMLKQYRKSVW